LLSPCLPFTQKGKNGNNTNQLDGDQDADGVLEVDRGAGHPSGAPEADADHLDRLDDLVEQCFVHLARGESRLFEREVIGSVAGVEMSAMTELLTVGEGSLTAFKHQRRTLKAHPHAATSNTIFPNPPPASI
jgi:hypothetical protein